LQGEYYDQRDFVDYVTTRFDPVVDFGWGTLAPLPPMGTNGFSVRWTGRVRAEQTQT
jgi:hypothetical protein